MAKIEQRRGSTVLPTHEDEDFDRIDEQKFNTLYIQDNNLNSSGSLNNNLNYLETEQNRAGDYLETEAPLKPHNFVSSQDRTANCSSGENGPSNAWINRTL